MRVLAVRNGASIIKCLSHKLDLILVFISSKQLVYFVPCVHPFLLFVCIIAQSGNFATAEAEIYQLFLCFFSCSSRPLIEHDVVEEEKQEDESDDQTEYLLHTQRTEINDACEIELASEGFGDSHLSNTCSYRTCAIQVTLSYKSE